MTCKWCHEFCPPNRKDGFCSDICKEHNERADKILPWREDSKIRSVER